MRAYGLGAWAALRAPLWTSGARLRAAIAPRPPEGGGAAPPARDPELEEALRAATAGVRVLARSRTFWRDTCLYRSLAQYLVLRAYGRPASVRIGVRRGEGGAVPVDAHAWVCADGVERIQGAGTGFRELRRAGE